MKFRFTKSIARKVLNILAKRAGYDCCKIISHWNYDGQFNVVEFCINNENFGEELRIIKEDGIPYTQLFNVNDDIRSIVRFIIKNKNSMYVIEGDNNYKGKAINHGIFIKILKDSETSVEQILIDGELNAF